MFADEVIEEVPLFRLHQNDVDTTTQAILRFRQGNFINLHSDEAEEEIYRVKRAYY